MAFPQRIQCRNVPLEQLFGPAGQGVAACSTIGGISLFASNAAAKRPRSESGPAASPYSLLAASGTAAPL